MDHRDTRGSGTRRSRGRRREHGGTPGERRGDRGEKGEERILRAGGGCATRGQGRHGGPNGGSRGATGREAGPYGPGGPYGPASRVPPASAAARDRTRARTRAPARVRAPASGAARARDGRRGGVRQPVGVPTWLRSSAERSFGMSRTAVAAEEPSSVSPISSASPSAKVFPAASTSCEPSSVVQEARRAGLASRCSLPSSPAQDREPGRPVRSLRPVRRATPGGAHAHAHARAGAHGPPLPSAARDRPAGRVRAHGLDSVLNQRAPSRPARMCRRSASGLSSAAVQTTRAGPGLPGIG